MLEIMQKAAELDVRAARAIASAMREVAEADGDHPEELEMIAAFEQDLPPGEADLSAIVTPEAKEAMLKSMVLLALADGQVSGQERQVILRIASEVGLGLVDVERATFEVASAMFSSFEGVHVFREQAADIGRDLGLDDELIQRTLG